MNDTLDVSGVWYGRWTSDQPSVRPNRFIAHLAEEGGQFAGTSTEPDSVDDEAVVLAYLEGARAGPEIRFVKRYDGSGHLADAVLYSGRINGTGTEIGGTWRFSSCSGSFTMQRERFTTEDFDAHEEAGEQVR